MRVFLIVLDGCGIGEMPDGSFYITHDSPLGLVSFLDPTDPSAIETVSGFATLGLFDDDKLPEEK